MDIMGEEKGTTEAQVIAPVRWTSTDLALMPDNGMLYEIVGGELLTSRQPHWHHQRACEEIAFALNNWSKATKRGRTVQTPGIIFDQENDVAPDVVWVSDERLRIVLGEDGHLHSAPELVVEVLSPGPRSERRDRELKRKLYSQRGVQEYWIADWRLRTVEVYRREAGELKLVETLHAKDELTSPLLPGFKVQVEELFD